MFEVNPSAASRQISGFSLRSLIEPTPDFAPVDEVPVPVGIGQSEPLYEHIVSGRHYPASVDIIPDDLGQAAEDLRTQRQWTKFRSGD